MTEAVQGNFVHLRTRSAYSLLDGMWHPPELVGWAKEHRMPAIALADDHNLFGVVEFTQAAMNAGIQPLIAVSLSLVEDTAPPRDARSNSLVLIAQNSAGYAHLNRVVTSLYLPLDPRQDAREYQQKNLDFGALADHAEGLLLLTGGLGAPLGTAILARATSAAQHWLDRAREAFGDRLFVELQRHGLPDEDFVHEELVKLADARQIPLVATNDCRFATPGRFRYHDALGAIAENQRINENEGRRRLNDSYYFRTPEEMRTLFADLPDALANTLHVARMCHFTLHDRSQTPLLPMIRTLSEEQDADDYLAKKARDGLFLRLEGKNIAASSPQAESYFVRMKDELEIIRQSGFAGYFLIVADFIDWSKKNQIPVGPGRGSGVGSLVAWTLGITALDPLEWNLLFERFLNLERISMPDFDIDFCTEKRDRVIDYVRKTYGEDCVAQIITFGKLRSRAVIRDTARVLGLPYRVSDQVCKMLPRDDVTNPKNLEELRAEEPALQRLLSEQEEVAELWDYATVLEGAYRHASTHAAGIVISDRSLYGEVALYYDPKNNLKTTQLNMKSVEKAGLVKFDFLGLSTMTIITACAVDIARLYHREIDFDSLPLDDPKVFALISEGYTDGVFQLESSGMRRMAVQLKPDCFADIIAMVALFRPGPMENIPRFIRCKHGEESISYPHPLLEDILRETYGIAVYQEQIMQMTQTLAGFSLGKSDQVRRAMGKKDAKVLAAMAEEFVEAAHILHNIPQADGKDIFQTIQAFADYGFNKSHSAAYALVAYWTAWLKAHHPDCLFAALLNNSLHAPNTVAQYLIDIRRLQLKVLAVDINRSWPMFYIEAPGQIRYGLGAVRGVGIAVMEEIVEERTRNGRFSDLGDFTQRTRDLGVNKRLLESLIAAGAMDEIIPCRRSAYEAVAAMVSYARHCREVPQGGSALFTPAMPRAPEIQPGAEWPGEEFYQHEYWALGLHFSGHPLDLYAEHLKDFGVSTYKDVGAFIEGKGRIRIGGFVYDDVLTKTRLTSGYGKRRQSAEVQPLYILKMSDAEQRFAVNLEGQELIDQALEILEKEKLLLIDVEARWAEIEWRFRGLRVCALSESKADFEESVILKLETLDSLEALHELLEAHQDSAGAEVDIIVPSAQGIATLRLPDCYRITLALRRKLTNLPGVQLWLKPKDYSADLLFDEERLSSCP